MDWAADWPRAECESLKKKQNQEPRWFLADPSLASHSGHSARYFAAVARELQRRGNSVELLGNRKVEPNLIGDINVHPAFTLSCDAQPIVFHKGSDHRSHREAIRHRHEGAMRDDLRRLDRMFRFHSGDVILLNSVRQWSLLALVDWVEEFPLQQAPTVAIVLHYTPNATPCDSGPLAVEYQRAFDRMATSTAAERFVIVADSRELQEEFARISRIPVGLVPIPHCEDLAHHEHNSSKARTTFAFVGEARADKGFDLLPDLILALRSKVARPFHFLIQAHSPEQGDARAAEARDRLKLIDEVELIPDPLSDEEYQAAIIQADVILLPYLRRHYHAQTSGIFAEALCAGKPVIVPSGTWMGTQAQEYHVGLVFEAGSLASLVDACERAIANLPELRERSFVASARWRKVHNAANFVAQLQRRVRQPCFAVATPT